MKLIIKAGAYSGERSELGGAEQVAEWMQQGGWESQIVPIPGHFAHLDALIVPIAPKLVALCAEALEQWVLDWLQSRNIEFIKVS